MTETGGAQMTQDESLPVNAELIERRLNDIWRQIGSGPVSGDLPVKLCLATCVIVADDATRGKAEQLAAEVAHLHPSRIILVTLDEFSESYAAHVSTLCTRDPQTLQTRCWEIVRIDAGRGRADHLSGALRSLVVESVPVVVVDFRAEQGTPDLDRSLARLADYSFVNATIVPVGPVEKTALPLRWYRTLPVRNLLSDLFVAATGCVPEEFVFQSDLSGDNGADLLFGWVLYRLRERGTTVESERGVDVQTAGGVIRLLRQYGRHEAEALMRIRYSNGDEATIYRSAAMSDPEVEYRAVYGRHLLTRRLAEYPLCRYVILTLQDDSEFDEYLSVCRTMMQYRFGSDAGDV